jgi:hypothetical protein
VLGQYRKQDVDFLLNMILDNPTIQKALDEYQSGKYPLGSPLDKFPDDMLVRLVELWQARKAA